MRRKQRRARLAGPCAGQGAVLFIVLVTSYTPRVSGQDLVVESDTTYLLWDSKQVTEDRTGPTIALEGTVIESATAIRGFFSTLVVGDPNQEALDSRAQFMAFMATDLTGPGPGAWIAPASDSGTFRVVEGRLMIRGRSGNSFPLPDAESSEDPPFFHSPTEVEDGILRVAMFHPYLQFPNGELHPVLSMLLVYASVDTNTGDIESSTLDIRPTPVRLTGTITFPEDAWTNLGDDISAMGGGVRFQDDRAFLLAGTRVREAASPE